MSLVLLWVLTIGLFVLGLAGVFVPALPGVGLVFGGVLLYAAMTGWAQISVGTVIALGLVALVAWLIEYLGAIVGTKIGGGGRFALLGTVLGAILGLLSFGPLGLVAGVVLGAMLGAIYEGKSSSEAGRAAFGSIVGIVGAKLLQLLLAIAIIIVFLMALWL